MPRWPSPRYGWRRSTPRRMVDPRGATAGGDHGAIRRRRWRIFRHCRRCRAAVYPPQDPTDNATPSGLSAAVHALRLMAELTGRTVTQPAPIEQPQARLSLSGGRRGLPAGCSPTRSARHRARRSAQVAIVGHRRCGRAAWSTSLTSWRRPDRWSLAGIPDQPGLALLADRPMMNNQPTAYVCRNSYAGCP